MTEFRWLNKLSVESSAGFAVQFTGRFKAEYREGGRIIVVRVEDGRSDGKPAICYSAAAFQAWAPSPEEWQRVEANFRAAMVFQGLIPVSD